MLLFKGICREIKGIKMIRDLSFQVDWGELVFLYSCQQRVKRELIDMIVGEKRPDSGEIKFFSSSDLKSRVCQQEIAVVYRENLLLPERTLGENLRFIKEIKGISDYYFSFRIDDILELVALKGYTGTKARELLPHQKKRANFLLALLSNPTLLIIEEPTHNLDEVNGQAIYNLIRDINKLGITVLCLSGNKRLLRQSHHCRVIHLKQGGVLHGQFL